MAAAQAAVTNLTRAQAILAQWTSDPISHSIAPALQTARANPTIRVQMPAESRPILLKASGHSAGSDLRIVASVEVHPRLGWETISRRQSRPRARVKVPDADLRQGQLESLPVDDQAVAGVVCALALEPVADLEPVFREFRRVLCPGGWLVVSVMHPVMAQIPGWSAWFIDEGGRADVATYLHQVSDYINAGLEHGFRVRHCREVPLDLSRFQSLGPAETEFGTRIAVDGLPLVLILQFETVAEGDQG